MSNLGPSESLRRLQEMVALAQAKTQVANIKKDMEEVAHLVEEASRRFEVADEQIRSERPILVRELEKADDDEQQLKDLIRQAAQIRSKLEPEDLKTMDAEIGAARKELQTRKAVNQDRLDAIAKEYQESEVSIKLALSKYGKMRKSLALLRAESVAVPVDDRAFVDADRCVARYEARTPWGRARQLRDEITFGEDHFGDLTQREQYYQLKIWLGTFRQLQDEFTEMLNNRPEEVIQDEFSRFTPLFGRLVGISKQHMPGYIEEFQQNGAKIDWDLYIKEARSGIQEAASDPGRNRLAKMTEQKALQGGL